MKPALVLLVFCFSFPASVSAETNIEAKQHAPSSSREKEQPNETKDKDAIIQFIAVSVLQRTHAQLSAFGKKDFVNMADDVYKKIPEKMLKKCPLDFQKGIEKLTSCFEKREKDKNDKQLTDQLNTAGKELDKITEKYGITYPTLDKIERVISGAIITSVQARDEKEKREKTLSRIKEMIDSLTSGKRMVKVSKDNFLGSYEERPKP